MGQNGSRDKKCFPPKTRKVEGGGRCPPTPYPPHLLYLPGKKRVSFLVPIFALGRRSSIAGRKGERAHAAKDRRNEVSGAETFAKQER